MQQDEQPIEPQQAEVPAETQATVTQPNGKKGGKAPGEKPAPAQNGDQIAALSRQVAQAHTKLDHLKKQVDDVGHALIESEKALEKPLLQIADDLRMLRKTVVGLAEDRKEQSNADARLLDAVNKVTAFTIKACETAIAGVEAQTGLKPEHAKFVRQMLAEVQAAKEGKGQAPAPLTPSQASHLHAWATGWAAIGCGAGVFGLLAWLLLG